VYSMVIGSSQATHLADSLVFLANCGDAL